MKMAVCGQRILRIREKDMGMILLQWCYFAITSFLTGFALLRPFQRKNGYRFFGVTSYMMAGLAALNVYAEYYSLFDGVGIMANLLVMVFDLAAFWILRKQIGSFLREKRKENGPGRLALYAFLMLLLAYGSSRGYMHYDTGLYHAQSIRWIEEYGVVPGLANLHSRFGYNSAAFALCALFGGAGLTRYPMHCVPGFFALLCAVKCTKLLHLADKKQRRVRLSDFLYVGCIFYLTAVFRELVSPASDYFAMLLLFFVSMSWAELWEREERGILPYALLAECLVYAVTVKLSTAPVLLLALYPGICLLREKKWKQITGYLALGVFIVFPYLVRNVLISGWLLYPFTVLDVFPVDWKLSKGYADSDASEIRVYAKEIYDVLQKDQPFSVWFPHWFKAQTVLDRLLVLAGWLCVPAGLCMTPAAVWRCFQSSRREKRSDDAEWLPGTKDIPGAEKFWYGGYALLEMTALLGFFFWQFGAPLVRYGYFYVLFLPLVTVGSLYVRYLSGKRGDYAFVILLVAFLGYRGYNLYHMIAEFWQAPYYVYQQDYGIWPASTYEVGGVTIYVPLDRGQIGYDKFPSSPVVQSIELREGTLESGFRKKNAED